jgi:CxxC motif-containing protein (DUF1111 family)
MILNRRIPEGLRFLIPSVVAAALVVNAAASRPARSDDRTKLGRELFTHKWVANDRLSPDGDGLGPMFNADSCFACHNLGGIGGAGTNDHDVELLSAVNPGGDMTETDKQAIRDKAKKVHPGMFTSFTTSTVVLHGSSTAPEYERWRYGVLGFKLPADLNSKQAITTRRAIVRKQSSQPPVADLPRKVGAPLQVSRRNTTALFGAGLIDSISESTLTDLARQQAHDNPGINGRVPRTADGMVGRFGWRGQVATLRDFVLTACAMELGLQNPGHTQAIDPRYPGNKLAGNDLSPEQCDALVSFIASLPAPRQIPPADQQQSNLLNAGERVFETIGCAACHARDLGNVHGIFSDLLLHDMGPALEDPLAAIPERTKVGTATFTGGYGGGSFDIFAEVPTRIRREWRTPPLWGVRDSAPYLHDGRARTIEESIDAHGGEAERSAARFRDLDQESRSHLLLFLRSLAAPRV